MIRWPSKPALLCVILIITVVGAPLASQSADGGLPNRIEVSRLKSLATSVFLDILQPPLGRPAGSRPDVGQLERYHVQGFAIDVIGARTFGFCIENEMYRVGNTRPVIWWWGNCTAKHYLIGLFFSTDAAASSTKLDFETLFFTHPFGRPDLRIWPQDQSQIVFKALFHTPVINTSNRSFTEEVRRKYLAAYYLARFGDQEGIQFLLNQIRDPDSRFWSMYFFLSAAVARPDLLLPELMGLLSHSDSNTRWQAVSALGAIGPRAASAAQEIRQIAKSDPDPFTRQIAIGSLYEILGRDAFPLLIEALETDAEPSVREWAAYYLGWLGDPAANEILLKHIGGREAVEVQVGSARSIARIGAVSQHVLEALRGYLLTAPSAEVRGEIAQTLAKLDDRESIPTLVVLLHDREPQVREGVIVALGVFKASEAGPHLIAAFNAIENQELRPAILTALARIGDLSALPLLLGALDDPDFEVFYAGADALFRIGKGELVAERVVEKILSDEALSRPLLPYGYLTSSLVYDVIREDRRMAAFYAAYLGERTAHRKLTHRSGAALIALVSIYHPGSVRFDLLLGLAQHEEPRARLWALRALGQLPEAGSESRIKAALLRGLHDADLNVRAEAARGMARLFARSFDGSLIAPLEGAIGDPEGYVRVRAAEALLDIAHQIEAKNQILDEDAASQNERPVKPVLLACAPPMTSPSELLYWPSPQFFDGLPPDVDWMLLNDQFMPGGQFACR